MILEFDENKRAITLDERGLDFRHAYKVFEGPHLTLIDTRKDYGEIRYLTIGTLPEETVAVVWTQRGEAHRIISMRKCNANEREKFKEYLDRPG